MNQNRVLVAVGLWLSVFALTVLSAAPASGQTAIIAKMPELKTETLAERELTLPKDLPGEKSLVLMAFEREQQKNVETWIDGMKLAESPLPWIETPVINPQNRLVRAFINGGMRRGITDEKSRERTITLYTDRLSLLRAMGLPQVTTTIYAVVVDRSGNVLAKVEGDYSKEKAEILTNAFK
jgi:hypothetical protein